MPLPSSMPGPSHRHAAASRAGAAGASAGEALPFPCRRLTSLMPFALVLAALALQAPPGAPPLPDRLPQPAADTRPITAADYPLESIRAREEGRVSVTLTIAPDGRVSDCAVSRSSGFSRLDSEACRLLVERARFEPALDSAGRPVGWVAPWAVEWRLPLPAPPRR